MKPINLNGYDTVYKNVPEESCLYIVVPEHADAEFIRICGKFIDGHLITQVKNVFADGVHFIKAIY